MRATLVVLTAGLTLLPAGLRAADPPKPPGGGRDADLEALKKQVESLRRRVDALEQHRQPPDREHRKVVVTSPLAKDVVITHPYAAKVLAHHHIDVRALTAGVVEEVLVKEGQAVKKGDVLVKVLPTLFKARLDAEQAEVKIAQVELDNAKRLFDQKAVSQHEVALYQAKFDRAQARAKLAEAELAFTAVRAPFDGLVGRIREQQGSRVKEGDALTTLSDTSVVWAYFDVPEARYLEYAADRERAKDGAPVDLVVAGGRKYPQAGKLGAIEARFQSDTGAIPFRADFPNPDGLLLHGQTGTVLMHRTVKGAVVIPRRATFEDGGKRYVWVVGKDDVAHRREVAFRDETDGLFVVGSGLDVTDRVVLDGARRVRDGEKLEVEFRKPEEVLGGLKH